MIGDVENGTSASVLFEKSCLAVQDRVFCTAVRGGWFGVSGGVGTGEGQWLMSEFKAFQPPRGFVFEGLHQIFDWDQSSIHSE